MKTRLAPSSEHPALALSRRASNYWLAVLVGALWTSLPARAQTPVQPPADYSVFVDLPTGFAFLKLPEGWKFAGKLRASDLTVLPPSVITSLLPYPSTLDPDLFRVSEPVAARESRLTSVK